MRLLGIETSCDETSAAIVEDGRKVLSNAIYTQIDTHKLYGGVVPEIASRKHIEKISAVVDQAFADAGLAFHDIDGVAVTYGPGLVGALLCGVSYAKSFAYALKKPLVKVHHIKGHIAANYLSHPELEPPFLCLVVSGGHSHIIEVSDYNAYHIVAQTRDDAAGEAFDKVARVIGLPYPGGSQMDRLAKRGDGTKLDFPRVHFPDSLDFSFSGLKTAVINYIHRIEQRYDVKVSLLGDTDVITREMFEGNGVKQHAPLVTKADLAASFTRAVVDILVENTIKTALEKNYRTIALAGGVACNSFLRDTMKQAGEQKGITVCYPEPVFCTDNAAMIASMGYYLLKSGETCGLDLNAVPYISIEK